MSSAESPPLLRPRPRRPFEIGPLTSSTTSIASSQPSSDSAAQSPPTAFPEESSAPPSRSRSILNLTSSTLVGIFSPTGYAPDRDEAATPWGTGAETPVDGLRQDLSTVLDLDGGKSVDDAFMMRSKARRGSMLDQSVHGGAKGSANAFDNKSRSRSHLVRGRRGFKGYWAPLGGKTLFLAIVGVAYGSLISNLHDKQQIAPVPVEGIEHDSPYYLAFWGMAGVALGWLMPYVDSIWNGDDDDGDVVGHEYRSSGNLKSTQDRRRSGRSWAPVWNDVVRTTGAVCGVAFAIRRIPWHSTLQLSLTLALSNPTIWYLLDRSAPGFILSTTVALSGTALLLGINPDLVPSPAPLTLLHQDANATLAAAVAKAATGHTELVAGLWTYESVAVATWIASVLFVSSVFFGNIGRRL